MFKLKEYFSYMFMSDKNCCFIDLESDGPEIQCETIMCNRLQN